MQPNKYQKAVIQDLRSFLTKWHQTGNPAKAYREHWDERGASKMPNYKDALHTAPQICVKVPTAGGKTLIGVLALKEIFENLNKRRGEPRMCVWLVPSKPIRDQVLKRFNTIGDGYWVALREAFEGRFSVLTKEQLLEGSGTFNADIVRDDVIITVLVYNSLRAKNKDDLRMYRQNSALTSFYADELQMADEGTIESGSLMSAIASLNPVVVVDESHNATTDLSKEMLAVLNPSCVFELTATPKANSNIISYVDAMSLRDEHMIKLPVVVRNLSSQTSVITHAIDLQKRLETEAISEKLSGGSYIRPIVLFQAETNSKNESLTFQKLKKQLIEEHGIVDTWIKIKTAEVDELKNENLLSDECQVRFVLTVNALKEGWDCPFAYVLATLADRSSPVDVEQVLGRILRQPYIRQHENTPLNMSYVLTSSSVFSKVLENIVIGLNRAGFSRNDFRTPDAIESLPLDSVKQVIPAPTLVSLFEQVKVDDYTKHTMNLQDEPSNDFDLDSVDATLLCGLRANEELETATKNLDGSYISHDLADKMDSYPVRQLFKDEIESLKLPQFYRRIPEQDIFCEIEGGTPLDKDMLLEGFQLADCDTNNFSYNFTSDGLAQIDLIEVNNDSGSCTNAEPVRTRLTSKEIAKLRGYFETLSPEAKVRQLSGYISNWLGKMPPLGEPDLRAYINKLLIKMTPAALDEILENQSTFTELVRNRVRLEMLNFRIKTFNKWLRNDDIFAHPRYQFSKIINPLSISTPCENTLYEREETKGLTDIEEKVMGILVSSENVLWWHRNNATHGFYLNGVQKHFPDFILKTQKGNIILLETKGPQLKGENSMLKIDMGKAWENCCGRTYRYFMVFESNPLDGAISINDFNEVLEKL